jgi:hypothetical protein
MHSSESYYVDSSGREVLHGVSTYWDSQGVKFAEGTWKDGRPLDGVCWIPAAGDAGSWAGLGHFERYKNGYSKGTVPGNLWQDHP